MKKVASSLKHFAKSSAFKKILIVVVIFGLGVITGAVVTNKFQKDPAQTSSSSRSASTLSPEDRTKRAAERLEESYKRSKERVEKDVDTKRLNETDAAKIRAKLEEVYKYKKENIDASSDRQRDDLRKKRAEWREWLEKNSVSSRYFIGII